MPLLSGVRRHSILSRLTNTEGYPDPGCAWAELSTLSSARDCTYRHRLTPTIGRYRHQHTHTPLTTKTAKTQIHTDDRGAYVRDGFITILANFLVYHLNATI